VKSRSTEKQFAMKVFPFEHGKMSPYFVNEAAFSSFAHPNVVLVASTQNEKNSIRNGKPQKVSYILMEYAPYGDFFDLLSSRKHLFDETLARTYFRQLINALAYLHSRGVAHLDLKPDNLLLGTDFQLKITDFDLSYLEGDEEIKGAGTKFYRSPELVFNTNLIPKSADIFSAGILLFMFKCKGQLPQTENVAYNGKNLFELMQNDHEEFWHTHSELQKKSAEFFEDDFKELFHGMTKTDPEERFTIEDIQKSNWFKGPVYSDSELKEIMRKHF